MKKTISIIILLLVSIVSLKGQSVIGKWETNAVKDDYGISKQLFVEFLPDSTLKYELVVDYKSAVIFRGIVPGKYEIKGNQLNCYSDNSQMNITAEILGASFPVSRNQVEGWLRGIDPDRIYNAFAAYFLAIPDQSTINSISDDELTTSIWSLKRYVDPKIKAQQEEEERLAAEAKAAEEARIAAEAKAAEEARLAAEAKAAQEARLSAEAKAAEEARMAAEAKAAEEARLAAEAKAAKKANKAKEAKQVQAGDQAAVAKAESKQLNEEQPQKEKPVSINPSEEKIEGNIIKKKGFNLVFADNGRVLLEEDFQSADNWKKYKKARSSAQLGLGLMGAGAGLLGVGIIGMVQQNKVQQEYTENRNSLANKYKSLHDALSRQSGKEISELQSQCGYYDGDTFVYYSMDSYNYYWEKYKQLQDKFFNKENQIGSQEQEEYNSVDSKFNKDSDKARILTLVGFVGGGLSLITGAVFEILGNVQLSKIAKDQNNRTQMSLNFGAQPNGIGVSLEF